MKFIHIISVVLVAASLSACATKPVSYAEWLALQSKTPPEVPAGVPCYTHWSESHYEDSVAITPTGGKPPQLGKLTINRSQIRKTCNAREIARGTR